MIDFSKSVETCKDHSIWLKSELYLRYRIEDLCLTLVRLRITLLSVELLHIIGELGGIFLRHTLAAGM